MSKEQWRKRTVWPGILCALALSWPAAAGAQEDANQLKSELQAQKQRQAELEDKINQLEARQKLKERALTEKIEHATEQQQKPAGLPDELKWLEKIKISGDFRYRYEYIDDDSAASDRHRNRIRARLGLTAKVSDEWDLGFRIATGNGEVLGDPVSTNQTFDEAFSKKPIWLDQAFVGYHPQWFEGFNAIAGKMENPFYKVGKNQLIWDGDLTPEGAALNYTHPFNDQTSVNLVTGGFWVNEESTGGDTSLWGFQTYLKHQIDKPTYVLGGAGWYDYGNIQGEESLADEWDNDGEAFFGNSSTAGDTYACDYDLLELFAEFGTEVVKLPVAVFGEYVQNTAADDEDTGWLIGGQINKAKDPGTWQFEYDYREVELDAVVGQFNDSDFIGGGTGGEGHRFAFTYMVAKNVAAGLTYFADEYDGRKDDANYSRLQADVAVKF